MLAEIAEEYVEPTRQEPTPTNKVLSDEEAKNLPPLPHMKEQHHDEVQLHVPTYEQLAVVKDMLQRTTLKPPQAVLVVQD